MADRVRVFQNDAGEMIARLPGSDQFIPVTAEDVAVLEEGNVEAFLRSADNAIRQAGTGARALGAGLFGADEVEAQALGELGALRREQELRGGESPIAGFAGSVAPDVALGALTGGASTVGRRIAATAAVEGGLGASRLPENPLMGAALQGGLGAGAMAAGPVLGAAARRVHPFTDRVQSGVRAAIARTRGAGEDPGIYRTASGDTGYTRPQPPEFSRVAGESGLPRGQGAGRQLAPVGADLTRQPEYTSGQMRGAGAISADEMVDRWSYPLSEYDAAMLDATDDAAFEAARMGKLEEWQRARTGGVMTRLRKGAPVDFSKLEGEQRRAMRRAVAAEIGQPQAQRLDRNTVGENLERISGEISELIGRSGPSRAEPILNGWRRLDREYGEGPAGVYLRRFIRQAEQYSGGGNRISATDTAKLRNRVSSAMEGMGKTESDLEGVEVMGAAREILDQELKKHWDADMQESFEELGYQWKLSQALVRGAKGAISDDGELLPGQFMNNWRMLDQMVKTGRKRENGFLQFMQGASLVRAVRGPESGTPAGLAALLGERLGDAALGMVPGGNLLR